MATMKPKPGKVCFIVGCGKPVRAKGLCAADHQAHYQRGITIEELARRRGSGDEEARLGPGEAGHTVFFRLSKEETAKAIAEVKAGRAKNPSALVRAWTRERFRDL